MTPCRAMWLLSTINNRKKFYRACSKSVDGGESDMNAERHAADVQKKQLLPEKDKTAETMGG